MAYPRSEQRIRSDRVNVNAESSAFYAGTQFRGFIELSLATGATLVLRMTRSVDVVMREFKLLVNAGELRCEVYRGGTGSGTWTALSVLPKCEITTRPQPYYTTQCTLAQGGSVTGGTLYDVLDVKTSGATAQQSTVGNTSVDILGIPSGTTSYYKFSNPSNSTSTGLFILQWEELPVV